MKKNTLLMQRVMTRYFQLFACSQPSKRSCLEVCFFLFVCGVVWLVGVFFVFFCLFLFFLFFFCFFFFFLMRKGLSWMARMNFRNVQIRTSAVVHFLFCLFGVFVLVLIVWGFFEGGVLLCFYFMILHFSKRIIPGVLAFSFVLVLNKKK